MGGKENLNVQQITLIDKLISLHGVIRGIEEFHQENVMTDCGQLRPALSKNYLSYIYCARRILCSLGLEWKGERILSPLEYISQLDRDKDTGQESTNSNGDGYE